MLLELAVVAIGTGLYLRTSRSMSWPLRLATLGLLGLLAWESTFGQRGAVLPMPSPALATPYLWQLGRDLVLVSVVAIVGSSATPRVRTARIPARDM